MLLAQDDSSQQLLGFIEADRKAGKRITGYEYAVLVTNLDHEVLSLGQLYRDRADAENTFDELKNQWGWGGFTTPVNPAAILATFRSISTLRRSVTNWLSPVIV